MKYNIQDNAGNIIIDNLSIDKALETVKHFEVDDKITGMFIEDFYQIKQSNNQIVGKGCDVNGCSIPTNSEGEE